MRLLLVEAGPNFSVADVGVGWAEALNALGCQAPTFNFADRLGFYSACGKVTKDGGEFIRMLDDASAAVLASKGLEAVCFEWWPDVVILVSCMFIAPETIDIIRARGMRVVILHTESPYEDGRQLERAAQADLNVLNDPTNLSVFQAVAPTVYLPHAYRPSLHTPGPPVDGMRSDFAMVGTGFESRVQFLEQINWDGIDVLLAGNWSRLSAASPLRQYVAHDLDECVYNTETVDFYRSTKASANIYRREAERPTLSQGWAMGPREVELAATGTFFLTEPRGENRQVLPMVPTFDGPADFEEKLRWWLAHDEARSAVVEAARAAIAPRTFEANAAHLLRLLNP